jgi:hypothetical protein
MWLAVSGLQMRATRGVLCRARCRGEASVRAAKQPGRERPPAAAPDPGPAVGAQGVAHAPAACPMRPDTRASARVVDPTPRLVPELAAARRAPRLETVTTVPSTLLRRGRHALIKPRTRGKQLVKHRTRLDRQNNETLYAYAHFRANRPSTS